MASEEAMEADPAVAGLELDPEGLEAAPADGAATAGAAGSEAGPAGEASKKKRGKPKDDQAPPKPKNAFQRVTAEARAKLKEQRPELANDLKAMGLALKEEWEKTPQEEKDRLTKQYEEEMEIWRPKWEAYKKTPHYKEFFELKQDWVDSRQRKKLAKKMAKDGPKRPKSGYMIFAGTIRDRVKEEVEKAGGGMGDIGKRISEEWNALSEAQKAAYAEQSARQKEEFDVAYAEYVKTDAYKTFCEQKAKLEGKQQLKKLIRTKLDGAPKKPPSAFGLFRSEVMRQVTEENKGLSMAELAKKVKELWDQASEEKKASYNTEVERRRAEYEKQLKDFKRHQRYTQFLEQRHKVKARENKLVNLRDLPKKPKSVFALFAQEHKKEVPAGKGEGKGIAALKQKWALASPEVKKEYERKVAERKQQWEREVKEYKESEKFKGYKKAEKKIKTEFSTEADKVLTLKFLSDAPPQPPKSPFAIFLNDKRKQLSAPEGERSGKAAKKDEITQCKEEWLKMDKETRAEYDVRRQEKMKEWQEQVKAYMAQDRWKEYIAEAKRLKIKVKNMLMQKKKVIKKLKNGLRTVPLPSKPADFPSKPPSAYRLFVAEKKKEIDDLTQILAAWEALGSDDKAKYVEEEQRLRKQFEEELQKFKASDAGKAYAREVGSVLRRRRVMSAKQKFLTEMPKKPAGALSIYIKENLAEAKKEFPDLKPADLKVKLIDKWKTLSAEEKAAMELKAREAERKYNEDMLSFKSGENWQKFVKAVKAKATSGKGKTKGKAGPAPPSKPDGLPQKPADAFKAFMQEKRGSGKNLADLQKMFKELPEEEQARRKQEADERLAQYQKDMIEFEKTAIGKKYKREMAGFEKKKKLSAARSQYLKDEPRKPQAAFAFFEAERRQEVQQQFPELRGLALRPKLLEAFKGLSEEEKAPFLAKEAEAKEAYDQAMEAFKKSDGFKKYQSALKRITGGGKGAKDKSKARGVPTPAKPANLPKRPPNGMFAFVTEYRAKGGTGNPTEAWRELGAEGQKTYLDQATAKMLQYEKDMKAFSKTPEGKQYLKLKANAEKRTRLDKAKERLLKGTDAPQEPKRPPSAYFLYVQEKRSSLSGSPTEIAKQLSDMWGKLPPEEKKVHEDKADQLKAAYEKEMEAYRSSPSFKRYDKVVQSIKRGGKAKPKPKAKPEAKGRGGGRAAGGGRGAKKAAESSSDSDVMGSDSDDSSSDDSDSD